MSQIKQLFFFCMTVAVISLMSCAAAKKMSTTEKGAAVGTAAGGVVGAVIGKATGNTGMGTIIGATVGGVAGVLIGKKMDKQAGDIAKDIPNVKVERVGEGIMLEFKDNVFFGYNRSDLSVTAKQTIDKLVANLTKYPDTNIEIQGHTDGTGSDEYNFALSNRRASTVSGYLTEKGIATARLTTKGLGKTILKYDDTTEAGKAQNRRVVFLIYASEKMKAEAKK
jgi:outer membrane protein OmpA-like peptidoglycan-associated protein